MRFTVRRALALALTSLVVPAVACVLADPPASVPPTPIEPPQIDHELVAPPVTAILGAWPSDDTFVIPIVVLDPTATVQWQAFLDYDPIQGFQSRAVKSGSVGPEATLNDAGARLLEAPIAAPADLTQCHTLEVLVALSFEDDHTPASPGGDSVTWFYSPTGSLDSCPIFEVPDGGSE